MRTRSEILAMRNKFAGRGLKGAIIPKQELVEQLHKPIIRKNEKQKVNSSFKYNIWGADIAFMQLLIKYNKGICFLLGAIDIYSKYAWIAPLKYKRDFIITNAFQIILDKSNRKPNKIGR